MRDTAGPGPGGRSKARINRLVLPTKPLEGGSGVQFRSKPVQDSHKVGGYQADIGMQ
jgi:hypothetical protein